MFDSIKKAIKGGHRERGEVTEADVYNAMEGLEARLNNGTDTQASIRAQILRDERATLMAEGTVAQIREHAPTLAALEKYNNNPQPSRQTPAWDAHIAKVIKNTGQISSKENRVMLNALHRYSKARDTPVARRQDAEHMR